MAEANITEECDAIQESHTCPRKEVILAQRDCRTTAGLSVRLLFHRRDRIYA